MIRTSTIFIAICMVLISASLGVILYSTTGLSASESGLVALAALTFLILYNAVQMRLRDRSDLGGQIADLSRGTADLARQAADFGRRIAAVEAKLNTDSPSQDRVRGLADEIGELGNMIRNLASAVAAHDEVLTAAAQLGSVHDAEPAHPAQPAADPKPQPPTPLPAIAETETAASAESAQIPAASPAAPASAGATEILVAVKGATEANRIDLYLQPIVALPQRKVRFYEAVSRLRDDKDRVISADQFVEAAEASGLIGQIDYMVLFRCVQVLRRLQTRSKDIGLFCNISAATLANPGVFSQCVEFLEANPALASSLVLEFKHAAFRRLGPAEREHLAALKRLGFHFSIDHVEDLRLDGRDLADHGVRYVKVPAALLLDQAQSASADIHAADLASLLSRFGIDLIAEKIEGERAVVDLLDYDIRFGQGFLFSAPKPLRQESAAATSSPDTGTAQRGAQAHEAPSSRSAPTARAVGDTRLTGTAALARRIAQS